MVAGGFDGFANLRSTEILIERDSAWDKEKVGELPRARNGLRATNVNNIIYVLGMETGRMTLC